jgi:hypothetical protein
MKRAATIVSLFVFAFAAAVAVAADSRAQPTGSEIVVAQDNRGGLGGFFQRLFRPRDAAPRLREPQFLRPFEPQAPARRERRSARQAPRESAAVEKNADAKRVLVVGDFLATALAKGLALAYQENPGVIAIDSTAGSSGLVRNDYYDWPGKLPEIAKKQKPDAILVAIGGNDRQGIDTDSGPYALGTDGWRTAYAGRVNALVDALRATGKPALWVGLMPVQSSTMSRDYSTFNGIVREQLEARGVPFIEVWNGFADEQGKYVAFGPDIRGQAVQLRASDGLNFTRAGQRKLAYFVEQELESIFGGAAPQLAVTTPGAVPSGEVGPQIGPMVPLDALAASGGETLATGGAEDESGSVAASISKRLAGEDSAPRGRAYFYTWPPPEPQPAGAAPPAGQP